MSRFRVSAPPERISLARTCFCHPGYDAPTNLLFAWPRAELSTENKYGIHFGTAHTACAIIAGNAFSGYLATDPAGTEKVEFSWDAILTGDTYYFFVSQHEKLYAVTPSFADWPFPHDSLPEPWTSAEPQLTAFYPLRCAVTGFSTPIDNAHLVPSSEQAWFNNNAMTNRYAWIDEIHNKINKAGLRRDVHFLFDQRKWVLVPKQTGTKQSADGGDEVKIMNFVGHILEKDTFEYQSTLQNMIVCELEPESVPFVFARFAWAILLYAKAFICGLTKRRVRVRVRDSNDGTYKETTLSGNELYSRYSGGGSQPATPQTTSKRKRGNDSAADAGGDEDSSCSSVEDDDICWRKGTSRASRARRMLNSSEETAPEDVEEQLSELRRALSVIVPDFATEKD